MNMDTKLINLNHRSQYITSINNFISSSKAEVDKFLNLLGWTEDFTLKKENLINCPFEDSHRIPEQRLAVHLESCPRRPPRKDNDGEARRNTSDIPEQQATQASCPSGDLLLTEFLLPYNINNDQSAPKTLQEVLQAERDLKRRRVRYRTCKVHTKSKSHTEVMRGVIGSQMQALEDWIIQEKGNISGDDETSKTTQQDGAEKKKEKREMIWLDWNFRGNPHTRWKDIVTSEKRRNSASGEENGKTSRRYNSDDSEVERNTGNSRRRYDQDLTSASYGNYSKNSYEKHRKKYDDRYRKTDYSKYEYKKDRKSYERSDNRRKDVTSKSRDRHFEIESDDTYSKKQNKYNKIVDKHEKYDDVNSEYYQEKRKRHKYESIDGHYVKHKKYRDESRERHKNRRSRSNSEKPSVTDENVDYKKKKHSKKHKKHRKRSKREKSEQTSDSGSRSD